MLLLVGVSQAWAGAGFYEVYFTYSYNGNDENLTLGTSATTKDLGILTADFKITSLYLKYWKDGSGNMCGGLMDYYIDSDKEYQPSWEWYYSGSGNNRELQSTASFTVAKYNGNSGSYTFWYRFKTWGSSNSSSECNTNYYIPSNSNEKNNFTYKIAPPAVNSFAVSASGHTSGSGTSNDPYIIPYNQSLELTLSGSKARTDANSSLQYNTSGTWNTTKTRTITNITSSATQSVTVKMRCYNSTASLSGTESSKIIYYKADVPKYTITFGVESSGGGTVTAKVGSTTITSGSSHDENTSIVFTATPSDGYNFTKWVDANGNQLSTSASYTHTLTANATVKAEFSLKPAKQVYLKVTGGWKDASPRFAIYAFDGYQSDKWVEMDAVDCNGDYYTAEAPAGYNGIIFVRLNPEGDGDSDKNDGLHWDYKWNQTANLTVPTESKNLFTFAESGTTWSTYSAPTYSITLTQTTGGTISVTKSSGIAINEQVTVTMTPSTGYDFKSGTIKIGNNAQTTISATSSTHAICGPTTITASWTAHTYTVKFNENGGIGSMADETFTYGTSKALTTNTFTKTGYTFAGWNTNADGTGTSYTNGQSVSNLTAENNGVVTLYAKWTAIEYTITYNDLYDITHSNPTIYTIESETITFTNPTRERTGYTFAGWNPTQITKGSTGNQTVSAQWTANEYTVTLSQTGAGTEGINSVITTYGSAMPDAIMPTAADGYVFNGYWDGENGTGTQYYKADGSSARTWDKTSATTLYAYFQKAEITGIAFETGEVPEGGYVTFEPTIEPTPSGKTVICWELKKGETTIDNSYIISVEETNNVKISIAELIANKGKGIYTIKATLRTGTGCESGTELSSYETNFANTDFILSTPIYLKPSATWQQHDARFAIYYWGDGDDNHGWVDMTTIGCSDEYYAAEIPIGYSDFKFVRLDPDKTENDWDNRWCETGNLTIPADGKNLFDMTQIYLNAQQGWTNDGARFAAYFYVKDDDSKTKWMSMSHVKDKIYKCDIPDDYNFDWVIFGRMNGSTSTNNWDNKWNQTNNLELTTDNVTHGNYYTITKFENGTTEGSWSWNDIAWSTLNLPTITITNENKDYGSISVKTIDGTEIASGTKVDWDTEVVVSIQPNAGYAVKSSSINIGGNAETIQSGKTYTICGNTTINISFEQKGEWYLAGQMNNWEIKDEYKLVDGKISVELKKEYDENGSIKKPGFKLVRKKGDVITWYGGGFVFKGLETSKQLNTSSGKNTNCSIEPVHDGNYLFVWDENTKTLTIEYPDVIFLHGSFNEWKDKAPHALHDRDAKVYLIKGNTYEFKVAEKGVYWTSDAYATTITESGTITLNDKTAYDNPQNGDYHNCKINATVTGLYTFHFDKETRVLTVTYPIDNTLAEGDYRLQYTNGTNNYYTDHVKKRTSGDGVDTVSLFIFKAGITSRVILQQYSSGTWTNVTTYNLSSMTLDDEMTNAHGGVWNFIIAQTDNGDNATVSNATTPERYTGKYYIRTDAADGGWNEYMIPENEIFFSSYARDNEGFDYYYCKYIGSGKNVKYNIANDYNSKLNPTDFDTDALVEYGSLPADGNVRFMWNSRTNELVGRAYLDGSSTENFLRITDATDLQDLDGNTITKIKFADLQNWIYQVDVQANTNTRIKLRAIYNGNDQFFKGDNDNTVPLLTSNNTSKNYKIRLIYNFKTNHLVCAWLGGDETITTDEKLTADMMIIRRDQEQAEQLSFNPNTKQLDLVGTAYAVMTFTKAFIQNETYKERQRSLYWVSFPFDVKISDVFGFGEYGEHWILQYYDGAERAKKGLFIDSGTYWKYITNTETILKKGVGYVLALDLNKVQFLHGVEDVSLYFPSLGNIGIIKGDGETTSMEVPAHQCTITHGAMDRTIYDSHWNLIGIPGFTDPGMIDVTNYNNQIPATFLEKDANLGFHYEFDLATNTYNVKRSTVAFKTMYSYLVQYNGIMEWKISAVDNTPAQIAARRNSNSNVPEKVSLRLEIAQNEQMIDQTFVQLQQEKATAEFDMNLDLTKIINSGANIYTLAGTNRIQTAGNTLPMENATVPVGVVISKAGEYTFRMPDGTDGIMAELIDYETNTTTNLLYDEYTVTLTKGTFESRFALFVRPNNTATSIENINGESTSSGKKVRKVLIDNILYIIRDGQMYDARGAKVK